MICLSKTQKVLQKKLKSFKLQLSNPKWLPYYHSQLTKNIHRTTKTGIIKINCTPSNAVYIYKHNKSKSSV